MKKRTLIQLDRERVTLVAKRTSLEKNRKQAEIERMESLPREIENLCILLKDGLVSKDQIRRLNKYLWDTRPHDYLTLKNIRLTDLVERELKDTEDFAGIGFLDTDRLELRFFAYTDENKDIIAEWKSKENAICIYSN